MIKLFEYYRSSASYRARIALALKDVPYETVSVDLLAGAHKQDSYKKESPQGTVPLLVDGETRIGQSLAIIEYLDDQYPEPKLVYGTPAEKAYIREMALLVACDIHPLNNPKVWKGYVGSKLGANEEQMKDWYSHWIKEGFAIYEALLCKHHLAGRFTFGDKPSMADLCLIPQIYNARRFNVDMTPYPGICAIEKNCIGLEAFRKAAPESHKEAPADLEKIHGAQSPLL